MSKKQPAISTLLKAANVRITELEKSLKGTEDAKNMYYKKSNDLQAEIDSVHLVLDSVTNSVPRIVESIDYPFKRELNMITRLAAWFASQSVGMKKEGA